MKNYKIGTKCIQAGYTPGNGEPRQIPIYQSTTFKYDTSEEMGKLFDLEASGYFYSRLQNPTNDCVAARIAALEGGTAAMLTSSGQAASAGLSGWLLTMIGYAPGAAGGQTEGVLSGIFAIATLVPALGFALLALILGLWYPLKKKQTEKNAELLSRRHENG